MMDEADSDGIQGILHYLNLSVVGGVETLFSDLIESGWMSEFFAHHVVSGTSVHEQFLRPLAHRVSTLSYLKKTRFGVYLPRRPRVFREARARRLSRRIAPMVIVAWNNLGRPETLGMKRSSPRASLVYLEHGACWDAEPIKTRVFLEQCDRVVCNSHAAKRVMEERFGVVADKVIRVPLRLGALAGGGAPQPRPALGNRSLQLGIAGRHIPLKGFTVVLHVLKALVSWGYDAELQVAGSGPELPRFQDLATRLGMAKRVHCHGHVSDMGRFFRRIDMLLVPSVREPFGLVSVEAAAHGCVVIASAVDGLPETMSDGYSGILVRPTEPLTVLKELGGTCDRIPDRVYDPATDALGNPKILDPGTLARAVSALVDDSARFRSISRYAIDYARSAHCFEAYARALGDEIRALSATFAR